MKMLEYGGKADRPENSTGSRNTGLAIKRGFMSRCPNCGEGKLFRAYIKSVDSCAVCGEEISHHRADDLPAYLTIFIVGHIVVAGFMATDTWLLLESWQHLMIWIPVTILFTLALLQPVKGAVIGLQWAFRMHGFSGTEEEPMLEPAAEDGR
jgi:uncharacterized protein (DUF983 family)